MGAKGTATSLRTNNSNNNIYNNNLAWWVLKFRLNGLMAILIVWSLKTWDIFGLCSASWLMSPAINYSHASDVSRRLKPTLYVYSQEKQTDYSALKHDYIYEHLRVVASSPTRLTCPTPPLFLPTWWQTGLAFTPCSQSVVNLFTVYCVVYHFAI